MGTLADLCASEIVKKELDKAYDNGYNNAIDEFAEALTNSLMYNFRHLLKRDTDGFDWLTTDAVETHINEISEQMKGER